MLLSIITVNLNNKRGLQKTIDSVVSQNCKDFEWIIIDGGSEDGSKDLIEAYSDYITLWVSEKDLGIYDGMNKGILASKGDYILFLNSGDALSNNNILSNICSDINNVDIIVYDILLHSEEKEVVKDLAHLKNLSVVSFLFTATFPHQSTLIKRDLFSKIGLYDINYRFVADWIFFWKACIENNASYIYKEGCILAIYDLDGISTKNREKAQAERYSFLLSLYPKRLYDYLRLSSKIDRDLECTKRPFYHFLFKSLMWVSNKFPI